MGVLDGIKVLELARVPPAEMPGMIMADMGADVLKIETPEPGRHDDEQAVRRTIHAFVNRNKRSMTLNMKAPEGQAIFRKLAGGADVIVEGFRPGVMDRLGAGYQALKADNPRLVYCSLSGFGQDGPYRDRPAHDMNYLSLAGVLNLIGDAGSKKPVIPLQPARRPRHRAGAVRPRAHRTRPARRRLLPRHQRLPAGGHAQHALLLLRRCRSAAR
jgi:crotonobetainyl-CoA:carnitine CoA-transferase CaiB-like acyl-CoA transferase